MTKRLLLLGLIACMALQSCAYFNTFFLSRKYFKDGFQLRKKDFYGPMSNEERGYYSKSLEKASFLFQFHKKSGWVDDALLLVGQIYYFRHESNEYIRALTKFNEILNNYPKSKLLNETRFWKARTLIAVNDLNEAETILSELLKTESNKKLIGQIYLELGNLYWKRELYSLANDYFQKSLENIPSYLALYANERCGDTYAMLFQYNDAHRFYIKALDYASDKTIRYKLTFKIIDAYNDEGNYTQSRTMINDLIEELRFLESKATNRSAFTYQSFLEIALFKQAYTMEKSGNYSIATTLYDDLVNNYSLDSITVYAHYQLGNYYLYQQQNLKTALFNFEKVAEQKNNTLIPEVQSKIETIKRIQEIKTSIQEMDLDLDSSLIDFYHLSYPSSPSVTPATLTYWRHMDSSFQILFPPQNNLNSLNKIKKFYQEIESGQIYTWQLELAEIYLLDLENPQMATQIYRSILDNQTSSNENKAIATFYLAWCYETLFHDNTSAQDYYQKLILDYYSTRFVQNILGITMPDDSVQAEAAKNATIMATIENYLTGNKIDSAYWFTNTWMAYSRDSIHQPIILTKLAYLFNSVILDQKKANQILARMEKEFPEHELTLAYKRSRSELEAPKTKPHTPTDSSVIDSLPADSTRKMDSTLQIDSTALSGPPSDSLPSPPKTPIKSPPTQPDTTPSHPLPPSNRRSQKIIPVNPADSLSQKNPTDSSTSLPPPAAPVQTPPRTDTLQPPTHQPDNRQ
ncbi:MAG: tetratricopeptide repeat protein [Candidatus Delongbacteria bacterium]|nr:tetratricopeptide repeat protein [Candidatus Delongbacteria bacterium]